MHLSAPPAELLRSAKGRRVSKAGRSCWIVCSTAFQSLPATQSADLRSEEHTHSQPLSSLTRAHWPCVAVPPRPFPALHPPAQVGHRPARLPAVMFPHQPAHAQDGRAPRHPLGYLAPLGRPAPAQTSPCPARQSGHRGGTCRSGQRNAGHRGSAGYPCRTGTGRNNCASAGHSVCTGARYAC